MSGPKFEHSDKASDLLNKARGVAVAQLDGRKVNKPVLEELAHRVRGEILDQVIRGEWGVLGITELDHIQGLRVTARRGVGLLEPPIVLDYDFSRTKLARLAVYKTVRPGARS